MNMRQTTLLLAVLVSNGVFSQTESRQSSSLYLRPAAKSDVIVGFDVKGEGHRFEPTWGLDQAWYNVQNLSKGINHMGAENIGIGRSAFRFTEPLVNDSALANSIITQLRSRTNVFNRVRQDLPLVLTADQEAGSCDYFVVNKSANTAHWAAMINSHVHWIQQNSKHPVVGISPFNEPDYWTEDEGATVAKQVEVAKLLKENYPRMADIVIVGGNTLNDDKAWDWFRTGTSYYDWGNTHQLAGSFENYANFFRDVTAAGKVGYADEMHNVGEAMVGLEYGMTVGIWWGFDSRARGEFCDITRHGERLAYAEHRNNWTAASVYRHDDGRVKAFIGSSERQAANTDFLLLSLDKDVYYDGYGPVHEMITHMNGGTGYQKGQTNAERVIDVTWGIDVPPVQITEGVYKIVNKATGNVVAATSGNICQFKYTGQTSQQWTIKPATERTGGDLSFYDIELVSDPKTRMNILNNSTSDNINVIAYTHDGVPLSNEQWYLEYVGDGYYYMRNRETAFYLTSFNTSTNNQVNVLQRKKLDDSQRDLQLWRILPVGVAYDTDAPSQPQNLTAKANAASVQLTWDANEEADLGGYIVVRSVAGADDWNTIARMLPHNYFVDNNCQQGVAYDYMVKAIDQSHNQSDLSASVTATPTGEPSMIARWCFDDNMQDATDNMMDVVTSGTPLYMVDSKQGEKSLRLNNATTLQLPYSVANSDELTIAMWVKWSSASNWQRIFDFGNGTEQYLFLTPQNSYTGVMRFAIKNGGDEQVVDCPSKLPTSQWKHVAVSIAADKTTIFIDGEEAASLPNVTIRPSDIRPVLNYLGRSQFVADPNFLGYLDDVRIYNYALGAADVKEVMGDTASGLEQTEATDDHKSEVYGLDGRRRAAAQRGVNILRPTDARSQGKKVTKVIIK